jgi:hypothetical protein
MDQKRNDEVEEVELDLPLHWQQGKLFLSPATEILFGGASGGGKSHVVRVSLITWCIDIPNLQCFIFREILDDCIGNHMDGPTGFPVMLADLVEKKWCTVSQKVIRFKNGSKITLDHLGSEKALNKHQGRQKHVLVIDEATQIRARWIRWLRGWVDMPKNMLESLPDQYRGKFPKIIYTGNPIGLSVSYFRDNFVKAVPPETIWEVDEDDGGHLRQFIPALLTDNPSADQKKKRAAIRGLGDEVIVDALETGNWDAPIGDFIKEFNEARHVVSDFVPPSHWFKFRTFDWGSAEPFAVYWIAVSDGKEFKDHNGVKRWFPRGALVVYREWYGCNPKYPSKGIGMTNRDIARGILERTPEETSGLTITDNLVFQERGMSINDKKYKTADEFFEEGVPLTLGNTARVYGYKQLKDRLKGQVYAHDWIVPMLFICHSCKYLRDYLPALQRHKIKMEDAVESGEATHSTDAIRLACSARPFIRDAEILPDDLAPDKLTARGVVKKIQHKKRLESG